MSDRPTPELLAELRRLHEAATPLPWEYFPKLVSAIYGETAGPLCRVYWEDGLPYQTNRDLIIAARNAMPALLDAAEALAAAEAMRDESDELRHLNNQRATDALAALGKPLGDHDDPQSAVTVLCEVAKAAEAENARLRAELAAVTAEPTAGSSSPRGE